MLDKTVPMMSDNLKQFEPLENMTQDYTYTRVKTFPILIFFVCPRKIEYPQEICSYC